MVCRAKYSEGFNFNDDYCRGIFIIGVPNAPLNSIDNLLMVIITNLDCQIFMRKQKTTIILRNIINARGFKL